MKTALAILALALVAPPAPANDPAEAATKEAASRFYTTCLKLNPRGLPNEEEMKTLAPIFSRELIDAISNARGEQQKSIREHPQDKAPWAEGNLFASNYEGVTSFSLGAPTFNGDKASIPAYLEYREGKEDKNVARWIDVIVLEHAGKDWLVWDIFMNAPWQFRSGPGLRAMLSRR